MTIKSRFSKVLNKEALNQKGARLKKNVNLSRRSMKFEGMQQAIKTSDHKWYILNSKLLTSALEKAQFHSFFLIKQWIYETGENICRRVQVYIYIYRYKEYSLPARHAQLNFQPIDVSLSTILFGLLFSQKVHSSTIHHHLFDMLLSLNSISFALIWNLTLSNNFYLISGMV